MEWTHLTSSENKCTCSHKPELNAESTIGVDASVEMQKLHKNYGNTPSQSEEPIQTLCNRLKFLYSLLFQGSMDSILFQHSYCSIWFQVFHGS